MLANAGLSLLAAIGHRSPAADCCHPHVRSIGADRTGADANQSARVSWTALAALVMLAVAGYEVRSRQNASCAAGGLMVWVPAPCYWRRYWDAAGVTVLLQPDPGTTRVNALPLLGMILGNAMTGVSLGLNALTTGAVRERSWPLRRNWHWAQPAGGIITR